MNEHAIANVDQGAPAPRRNQPDGLRFSVGLDRKLSDNNYGTYAVSVHIAGVTTTTTEAEMDALINDKGRIAYAKLIADLGDKLTQARRQ